MVISKWQKGQACMDNIKSNGDTHVCTYITAANSYTTCSLGVQLAYLTGRVLQVMTIAV